MSGDGRRSGDNPGIVDLDNVESLDEFAEELNKLRREKPRDALASLRPSSTHVNADEQNVEQGLAKLVLSLVELLRQLLEKQALRRMEAGTLDDEEIERLGTTFMRLQEKIEELKVAFGLENESLNIDLGPLGKLLDEQSPRKPR